MSDKTVYGIAMAARGRYFPSDSVLATREAAVRGPSGTLTVYKSVAVLAALKRASGRSVWVRDYPGCGYGKWQRS